MCMAKKGLAFYRHRRRRNLPLVKTTDAYCLGLPGPQREVILCLLVPGNIASLLRYDPGIVKREKAGYYGRGGLGTGQCLSLCRAI